MPMNPLFVHGVPETRHIWEEVLLQLGVPLDHALSLPGFLEEASPDFAATKDDYVAWLIAEVERVGEPVDLVGHDWGFILATRVASVRPDLVRTLIGGSGPICADYEWHPLARIWQEEAAELLSLDCGHFVPAERPAEYARAVGQHWERFSSL